MLNKCTSDRRAYLPNNGKGKARSITSRIHRKTLRIATKPSGKRVPGKKISLGKNNPKNFHGSKNFPPTTSSTTALCDNSNDSGLGFDQHESHHHHHHQQQHHINTSLALTNKNNNNNNNNININNNNNVNYRPLNNIRYNDVIQCTMTQTDQIPEKLKLDVNSSKSQEKVRPTLMLRSDTEDTCSSDDFFSSHYLKTSDCKSNNQGSISPTENLYHSSPDKRSLSSGSEGSSPTSSTTESPLSIPEHLEILPTFSLHKQFPHASRDGIVQLQIITQPEQQHRARYQTEGSRGAVKDRSGNGFPVVKLNGYNKPTTLQVFIGNDVGRVSPHIFYQACKVSGKNSTPCNETKTEGTMVIEIELKPENDMTCICDCVGILKERNVDVEHRLGRNHTMAASVTRNKKKSTKCRMVFRTKLNDEAEFPEVLQICSNTITCTQPPGIPEICKKSLDTCSVIGGTELFIIGKNFLKDTKVTFVRFDDSRQSKKLWEETVQPDKEYLQQTHLICVVPPYPNGDGVQDPVQVQIYVTSSNKKSEPHNFIYLPLKKSRSVPQSPSLTDPVNVLFGNHQDASTSPTIQQQQQMVHNVLAVTWTETTSSADTSMMPPPLIMPRKSSFSKNLPEASTNEVPIILKTEFIDQTAHSVINSDSPADVSTSSSTLTPMFNDSTMIDVTVMQNPYVPAPSNMMAQSQVQNLLDGYKMQSNDGDFKTAIELHHIKNEQVSETSNSPAVMLPSQTSADLNPVQQQQVVENFLHMIAHSSVMNEPAMVVVPQAPENTINHHRLAQDIILNSPSAVTAPSNVIQNDLSVNSGSSNMILNSAITQSSMICEQNLMAVQQMVQDNGGSLINSHENPAASSIVSNAVSDATAETQAVVKQMIAAAAAEILSSENQSETHSTINNFITTLGTEQQQISSTQQLQEMLVQELNVASSGMIADAKKEETNGHQQQVQVEQGNLINAAQPTTAPTTNITQPFSPTTQDLTTMSENDLISFINPSVFM